jgi:predicted  nucleic acid-binding Zn-ribbon protein
MADLKRRLFGFSSASVRSLLTERDAALDRASKNAGAAERAEHLSSELSETKDRLAALEDQLDTAQKLGATLAADLERSVAQRESMEAEVLPLRRELEDAHTALRAATQVNLGQAEHPCGPGGYAGSRSTCGRAERMEQATGEVAEGRASLQRALEESAGYQAAAGAEQTRLTELEALVEGYRELIEGGATPRCRRSNRATRWGRPPAPRPRASWPP